MTGSALWVTEAEVGALFTLDDAIETLRNTFSADPSGFTPMPRGHARAGDTILHAVGGVSKDDGVAGAKTWLYSSGGAAPLTVLYDLDGTLLGVVEAFRLGQWRTAATTALATAVLAPPEADVLTLVGSGRQALAQALAVARVRKLRRVHVWGRHPQRLASFIREATAALEVGVHASTDLSAALAEAGIVVTVTRAADAFLGPEHLCAGMHINAVGAIVPSRAELRATAVGRCDVVVADSVDQARRDSGELRAAADRGLLAWEDVRSLHDVLVRPDDGRRSSRQLTLFKSLGVGMSDVALGAVVLRRARTNGVGTRLPATPHPHSQPLPTREEPDVRAKHV